MCVCVCVCVCVWVCVLEGSDHVLHHQISALFCLLSLHQISFHISIFQDLTTSFLLFTTRFSFSLFSHTHPLIPLLPLSSPLSGWRPSGSGTVIYVVWLFALNGMFYSVVGGSHWLFCCSPEPCIKTRNTSAPIHTHTRSKRMIYTDVFLLHFEHSDRKGGDRQID